MRKPESMESMECRRGAVWSSAFIGPMVVNVGPEDDASVVQSLFTTPRGQTVVGSTNACATHRHTNMTQAGQLGNGLGDMLVEQVKVFVERAEPIEHSCPHLQGRKCWSDQGAMVEDLEVIRAGVVLELKVASRTELKSPVRLLDCTTWDDKAAIEFSRRAEPKLSVDEGKALEGKALDETDDGHISPSPIMVGRHEQLEVGIVYPRILALRPTHTGHNRSVLITVALEGIFLRNAR